MQARTRSKANGYTIRRHTLGEEKGTGGMVGSVGWSVGFVFLFDQVMEHAHGPRDQPLPQLRKGGNNSR